MWWHTMVSTDLVFMSPLLQNFVPETNTSVQMSPLCLAGAAGAWHWVNWLWKNPEESKKVLCKDLLAPSVLYWIYWDGKIKSIAEPFSATVLMIAATSLTFTWSFLPTWCGDPEMLSHWSLSHGSTPSLWHFPYVAFHSNLQTANNKIFWIKVFTFENSLFQASIIITPNHFIAWPCYFTLEAGWFESPNCCLYFYMTVLCRF